MKRLLCCVLAMVMMCSTASALPMEEFYPDLLRGIVTLLAEGDGLHVTVQDAQGQVLADGAGTLKDRWFAVDTPQGRVGMDAQALYLEKDGQTVGIRLDHIVESVLKQLTGLEEIPAFAAEDWQALVGMGQTLKDALSREALSAEFQGDAQQGSLAVKIDTRTLRKELDAAVTALLTEQSGTVDALLTKYAPILNQAIPGAPRDSSALLGLWQQLMQILPGDNVTATLTLIWRPGAWRLVGYAAGWQVDVSWENQSFQAKIVPGSTLPEGTPSLIIESGDLQRLAMLGLDVVSGITGDAVRFEHDERSVSLWVALDQLTNQLHTSVGLCLVKHRAMLADMQTRYGLILQPLSQMLMVRQEDVLAKLAWSLLDGIESVLRNVTRYSRALSKEIGLEARWSETGIWQASFLWLDQRLVMTGDRNSLAAEMISKDYRRGRDSTFSLDASWSEDGFLLKYSALQTSAYSFDTLLVEGRREENGFRISGTYTDRYESGTLIIDGVYCAEGIALTVSSSFGISGEGLIGDCAANMILRDEGEPLFSGVVEYDETHYALNIELPKAEELYRIQLTSDWQTTAALQLQVNQWGGMAQLDWHDGVALKASTNDCDAEVVVRKDQFRLISDRFDIHCALSPDEVILSHARWVFRYKPGMIQVGNGADTAVLEDITALTPECTNALLVYPGISKAWRYGVYTIVASEMGDAMVLRVYEVGNREDLLLGQVVLEPLKQDVAAAAKITPDQWEDFAWLENYLQQQFVPEETPVPDSVTQ